MDRRTLVADEEYFNSGRWKCDKSPNGAHHYIIDSRNIGVCKYCKSRKDYNKIKNDNQMRNKFPFRRSKSVNQDSELYG